MSDTSSDASETREKLQPYREEKPLPLLNALRNGLIGLAGVPVSYTHLTLPTKA